MEVLNKSMRTAAGWVVFAIGFVVYFLTAERAGSLWDCGEFISAAYKLQVVHPPGAPLFILVGRIFAIIGDVFSSDPRGIAFGVNMLSGTATAAAGMLVCWSTIRLVENIVGKHTGEEHFELPDIVILASGVIAGLSMIFSSSIWFSAVEGEVYALSLFFMALTLWSTVKWYTLPNDRKHDRWLVFAMFSVGISIGVHLLSLLILPIVALLLYFKRYNKESILQIAIVAVVGAVIIGLIQKLIIVGIPQLWQSFEIFAVNGLGLPYHSGLLFALLVVAVIYYLGFRYAKQRGYGGLQLALMSALMISIGYSTIGIVVIRANAKPPINMSNVYDVTRLIPYINREQYGERPILKGPQFTANPVSSKSEDRYGRTENGYEVIDKKVSYVYADKDKVMFPRMSSPQSKDHNLYKNVWMSRPDGQPTSADNMRFFFKYQLGWMYWRYFFWNFVGRQNFNQGFLYMDKANGHWLSGIKFIDEARLYDMSMEPTERKHNESRNKYFGIPFILGLIGLFYHFKMKRRDALALLALFVITGIGLIIYSNQPPLEPRERDYVLVGSFMTFCMWIGIAIPALYSFFKSYLPKQISTPVAIGLVMVAPILMGFQNWDDHSRRHLLGASDICGANYLESCQDQAILFTFGDNDTYPVWYAQEVEKVRTDVRPINLSLIGIDYYVDAQRRAVNESEEIDFITPRGTYRGDLRNYIPVQDGPAMSLKEAMKYVGESHPLRTQGGSSIASSFPTKTVYIEVDKDYWYQNMPEAAKDSSDILDRIQLTIDKNNLFKGDLAVLDMLAANFNKRPIYYTSTSRDKTFGLENYFQTEGICNRLVPVRTNDNNSIALDRTYDLLMNDFKWGNFDKYEMYVDDKFNPSFYAHGNTFMGVARQYVRQAQMTENILNNQVDNLSSQRKASLEADLQKYESRAKEVSRKFFEVFPPENFSYQPNFTLQMIQTLCLLDDKEGIENYLPGFVDHVQEYLEFYSNMSPDILQNSQTFSSDYRGLRQVPKNLLALLDQLSDGEELKSIVTEKLGSFISENG